MKFLIFKGETKLIVHLFKIEAVNKKYSSGFSRNTNFREKDSLYIKKLEYFTEDGSESIKAFIIKNYNIYTIRNIHKEHFLKQ